MGWSVIVNADDYALTEGVSRAILRAHSEGVVTATSVLTLSPAFANTAPWLDDVPDLAAGLHLCAVGEDPPLLSAREVPTLVDGSGGFAAASSLRMAPRLAARRVDPADLRREFEAQHEAFVAVTGRQPTHLDTHHNLHLWPTVGALLADLARAWDVPVVRLPWSRTHTPLGIGIRRFARTLRRNLDDQGCCYTDEYFGIDQAGRMDTPALVGIVQGLRGAPVASVDPIAEIAVHPGEPDDPDLVRYPWPGSARDVELAALTSSAVREAFTMAGHALVTPAALLNRREHAPPAPGAAPPPRPARRSPPRP